MQCTGIIGFILIGADIIMFVDRSAMVAITLLCSIAAASSDLLPLTKRKKHSEKAAQTSRFYYSSYVSRKL